MTEIPFVERSKIGRGTSIARIIAPLLSVISAVTSGEIRKFVIYLSRSLGWPIKRLARIALEIGICKHISR